MSPLFIQKMDFKSKVKDLLEEGLAEHPELFLIDFSISADYKISVVIDGDNGVNLQDCIDVSRSIEHNLDREEQDFSLEVASAGATAPFAHQQRCRACLCAAQRRADRDRAARAA